MSNRPKSAHKSRRAAAYFAAHGDDDVIDHLPARPKSAHHRRTKSQVDENNKNLELYSGTWDEDLSDGGIELLEETSSPEFKDVVAQPTYEEEILELTMQSPRSLPKDTLLYDKYKSDNFENNRNQKVTNPKASNCFKKSSRRRIYSDTDALSNGVISGDEEDSLDTSRSRAYTVTTSTPVGSVAGWDEISMGCSEARERVLSRYSKTYEQAKIDCRNEANGKIAKHPMGRKPVIPRKLRPLFKSSSEDREDSTIIGISDSSSNCESPNSDQDQFTAQWQNPEAINPVFRVSEKIGRNKLDKISNKKNSPRQSEIFSNLEKPVHRPHHDVDINSQINHTHAFKETRDLLSRCSTKSPLCRTKSDPETKFQHQYTLERENTMLEMIHKFKTIDT